MVRYNRILLNYLREVMSRDDFSVYMDFIGEEPSVEDYYIEEVKEVEEEEKEKEEMSKVRTSRSGKNPVEKK